MTMGGSANSTLSLLFVSALLLLGHAVTAKNVTLTPSSAVVPGVAALQLLPNQANWPSGTVFQQFSSAGLQAGTCNVLRVIFNGTAVSLYGGPANTVNLSSTTIVFDGADKTVASSTNAKSNTTLIFAESSLNPAMQHVLSVFTDDCSNATGTAFVSFASAVITAPTTTNAPLTPVDDYDITLDTAAKTHTVSLFPPPTVVNQSTTPSLLLGNSSSDNNPATMGITFLGTGIEAYTFPVAGSILSSAYMTIDGMALPTFNATETQTAPVLFANLQGLSPGWHSLAFWAAPIEGESTFLSFAFANVTGYSSKGSATDVPALASTSSVSLASSSSKQIHSTSAGSTATSPASPTSTPSSTPTTATSGVESRLPRSLTGSLIGALALGLAATL